MDCQWQEWGPWSQCSSTCGNGERSSLRIVKQEAKNGGEPCNEIFEKHETCTNRQCLGTVWYMFQLMHNSLILCYLIYVYAIDNSYPANISDSNGQRCVPDKNSENYNRGVTSQWCQDRSDQGYCSNPCKAIEQDLFTREDLLLNTNGLSIFDLH